METGGERRSRASRLVIAGAAIALLILAVFLVVTQIDKWTCGPPDSVWVESPDRCIDLP